MVTPRISRKRGGGAKVRLSEVEREVLQSLLGQMRELLTDDDDPDLVRLYPTAYTDDLQRDVEYRHLMHEDLRDGRLRTLTVMQESLHADVLDDGQIAAWLATVNDLRLVLGTKLDITEDLDLSEIKDDHPQIASYALYEFLTILCDQLVGVAAI